MKDAWYVAEPDGETWGPYAYADLMQAVAARQFAAESLAWHIDLGEWRPLARLLGSTTPSPTSRPEPSAAKPSGKKSRSGTPPPVSAKTNPGSKRLSPQQQAQIDALMKAADLKKAAATNPNATSAEESSRRFAQVMKRLFARYIDVLSIGLLAASVGWRYVQDTTAGLGADRPEPWLLLLVAFAAWLVIESVLIGTFGTTPGKWLLGLRVRDANGDAIGLSRAFRRSFMVYARGLAFGLFALAPFAMFIAGVQTLNDGRAPWDRDCVVEDESVSSRWQLIVVILVVLWIAASEGWWLDFATTLLR